MGDVDKNNFMENVSLGNCDFSGEVVSVKTDIRVSELELLYYYVHFLTNTRNESMNSLIPPPAVG